MSLYAIIFPVVLELTAQNERDYEKILCLLEQLKDSQQSRQTSVEKIFMQSRASQYEVIDSGHGCFVPQTSQFEQPAPPCYVEDSFTSQSTDPEPAFSSCCGQKSVTPPPSKQESARTSLNCCGQNEQNGKRKSVNGKKGNEQNEKSPDEIVVNEIRSKDNENQELVSKVIIPPCRCCHKCTCTPKSTAPPRPNICLETDEKKKSITRECGGTSDHYDDDGEESLSPSGYHFVSDKSKPKANVPENKTSLNDSTKSGVKTCSSKNAARTESLSVMFTNNSIKCSKKAVFQSATNNSSADIPATSDKDKNTPELDLYGNYDTSGYATEPEDNNDAIDNNNARNNSTKEQQQFLPVTLQYIRNSPAAKTTTPNRNTSTKKHCKKRTTSTSKSPSSRLSRL